MVDDVLRPASQSGDFVGVVVVDDVLRPASQSDDFVYRVVMGKVRCSGG